MAVLGGGRRSLMSEVHLYLEPQSTRWLRRQAKFETRSAGRPSRRQLQVAYNRGGIAGLDTPDPAVGGFLALLPLTQLVQLDPVGARG